uniref:Uncharacterized protein n=1 Tax=Arundo donax TaxID=35708 RepID=A0A0A9HLV1_ARUDO
MMPRPQQPMILVGEGPIVPPILGLKAARSRSNKL